LILLRFESGSSLTTESFHHYDFHRVWGGTKEDCTVKMDAFFESEEMTQLEPVAGAYEGLLRLKESFRLHIVTARQHKVESLTRSWIGKHYPDIFEEIHFGNHYTTVGKSRSKPEMCKEVRGIRTGRIFPILDQHVAS
jgi:uncharacterized HAD superfamily protein